MTRTVAAADRTVAAADRTVAAADPDGGRSATAAQARPRPAPRWLTSRAAGHARPGPGPGPDGAGGWAPPSSAQPFGLVILSAMLRELLLLSGRGGAR